MALTIQSGTHLNKLMNYFVRANDEKNISNLNFYVTRSSSKVNSELDYFIFREVYN